MADVKRFGTERSLIRHFALHRNEFGTDTEADYEARAIAFLGGEKRSEVEECWRKSTGELIRFNPTTNEYGVASGSVILTYFKAKPCSSVPHWDSQGQQNCHEEKDNMTYFRKECLK